MLYVEESVCEVKKEVIEKEKLDFDLIWQEKIVED